MDYFESCLILIPITALIGLATIIIKKKKGKELWDSIFKLLFILYLIALFDILFLPIPISNFALETQKKIYGHDSNFYNIVPLWSMIKLIKSNIPFTYVITQAGGNIALFVPMGFFLALNYIRQQQFIHILEISLIVSLGVEALQLSVSLAFGYPYRYADVDDLIFNVIGALLGLLCYKIAVPIIESAMKHNKDSKSQG